MSRLKRFAIPAALAASLALMAIGCAQLPTSPVGSPATATAQAPGTSEQFGLIGGVIDLVKGLLFKTLNLVGSLGGSLTNGRWKVVVPPNAVEGNAAIALGVAGSDSPACQLEITPAEKNRFSVPVTLTASCKDISNTVLASYVIRWWDPVKRVWVPVEGSRVDLANKTVSAPLSHFSTYSVGPRSGRAGW